ncbi:MAG: hypothetical protein KJ558_14465, partial [Gammaproteobacteria bacterium]|nr:hypothetical protein [Gammaproteobacteria bacterium]MBU1655993.1 hypothetical protein [Gammaproteobacteria bacterium]MBU1962577.1 hypothetical protein [Gammaproteobacteria bacterium]
MERYLATLSLGPVQGMIAAARRTRDLWAGSWLLSEASRAAAHIIHQAQPGSLIFPAPADPDRELAPQDRPGDGANISNIIRAELAMDEAGVRQLCERAKQAARDSLVQRGEEARAGLPELRDDPWQAQIDDILEGFAAWARIEAGDYAGAGRRLGATLAARNSHSAPNFTTNPYFIAANRSTLSPTTLAARTNHNSIHQKVLDKIAA